MDNFYIIKAISFLSRTNIETKIHIMQRTLVLESIEKIGKLVKLQGWVDTVRDHGKITFIDLRDRTGIIQCVGSNLEKVTNESVVEIIGKVVERPEKLVNPDIETGKVELQIEKMVVVSPAEELPFDMSKDDLNLELPTLLDYRSLTLRHRKIKAIFRVQEVVIDAFRRALQAKEFMEFQAPSIISSAPEGGAEIFEIEYFGHKTYLAQSPQLYKSLLVSIFERVFSVNKVFRAEPSVTTRHLTEIVSLDAEFGFIDSWKDVLEMEEYVIRYTFSEVEKKCMQELSLFDATLPKLTDQIPVLKLREAQKIIYKRTGRDVLNEKDLPIRMVGISPCFRREVGSHGIEEKGLFRTHQFNKQEMIVICEPSDSEKWFEKMTEFTADFFSKLGIIVIYSFSLNRLMMIYPKYRQICFINKILVNQWFVKYYYQIR